MSCANYFLLGRCVSAEAAADFAAELDFGSRRTFAAADATFALVTSLLAIKITSFRARVRSNRMLHALPLDIRLDPGIHP